MRASVLILFPTPACLFVDGSSSNELSSFSVPSCYHAYQDAWSPFTEEILPRKREPDNPEDVHAVAIKRVVELLDMYRLTSLLLYGLY